jgi:SAM-dependent methyltransferase
MTTERIRARVFGEVADEYDRIRPGYPAALVDDVLTFANLGDAPALEVGAGTGKATVAFADRGVTITAIEPDEAMANVLRRRLGDRPTVTVTVSAFEDYVPARPFGLLFSGQAWHWTDPAVRWQRSAAALAPGGALALFWNNDQLADAEQLAGLLAAHREHAPQILPEFEPFEAESLVTSWPRTELDELPEFGDLSVLLYRSARTLSTVDYLALLSTRSAYRLLGEATRTELFDALRRVLGPRVDLDVDSVVYLARRQAD